MTKNKRFLMMGVIIGILVTLIAAAGYRLVMGQFSVAKAGSASPSTPNAIKKTKEIEKLIAERFLHDFDKRNLTEAMHAGLVDGLDDEYSYYFTAEEYTAAMESLNGHYQGIGVILVMDKDSPDAIVGHIYESAPAEKAGLKVGDIIIAVDGADVTEKTVEEIGTLIREGENLNVELTLTREGENSPLTISIEKGDIEMTTVASEMLEDKVGYISIVQFSQTTAEQFERAYTKLQEEGMEKLLVDLRDNPGGSLPGVCDTLRVFMPKGLLVYSEDRQGQRTEFESKGDNPIEIPLVVLINGGSASASEIFAGAVKDYQVGKLVGETTFGKGVVQSIFSLNDGSAVKLTTSAYFTPEGNNINGTGIAPDVEVQNEEVDALTDEATGTPEERSDKQFEKALEVLKSM